MRSQADNFRAVAEVHREAGGSPERTALLHEAFLEAQRAWPAVSLAEDVFAQYVTARLPVDDETASAVTQLRAADLYLACAVGRKDPVAIAAFEAAFFSRVRHYIGRIDTSTDFVAEATQALRVKLLVGDDGAGKLAQYAGRGALQSWMCAAALRTAHDMRREQSRAPADAEADLDELAASDDVELQVLRSRYQVEFGEALQAALTAVVGRERTLLRLYFVEQLTAAGIGQLYGVHETTALRWIVRAREGVALRVHAQLKQRLSLSADELDDLMALLRSRIDVTVRRWLRTTRRE